LPERAALARRANQLAAGGGAVAYWPRTVGEKVTGRLTPPARRFAVELSGEHAETIEGDEIIANVGFRPDSRIDQELQFQEGYTTEGPIKPEPNFYILGAKSYGRRSDFLLPTGYQQIRDVFKLIGDRATLDLYASAVNLVR